MTVLSDRLPHPTISNKTFIDGYEMQIDPNLNHRLVNHDSGQFSEWTDTHQVSVLGNKMVATEAYLNRLPIYTLIEWAGVRNLIPTT